MFAIGSSGPGLPVLVDASDLAVVEASSGPLGIPKVALLALVDALSPIFATLEFLVPGKTPATPTLIPEICERVGWGRYGSARIDLGSTESVLSWCEHFQMTEIRMTAVIGRVGAMANAVECYIASRGYKA